MSEENKQRLKEHQKNYCEVKSSALKIFFFFFTYYKNGG